MKAFVKDDVCIGCGLCAEIEPSVFQMKDNGKAEAYAPGTEETDENMAEAIDSCPVEAIEEA